MQFQALHPSSHNGGIPPKHHPTTLDPAILAAIQDATASAAQSAVQLSIATMRPLIESALATVETRLAAVQAPTPLVAAIRINDTTHTLPAAVSKQTGALLARMIVNAKLGINTMLVGPSQCGKSTLVRMTAEALGLDYYPISWTEGMSEKSSLMARQHANGFTEAGFSKAFRNGGLALQDELDKANPNAVGVLNMALSNGHFYNDVLHENITRHPKFACIATCNAPRGGDAIYTATNRLSADCMQRFVLIPCDYDPEYEKSVCPDGLLYNALISARMKLRSLKAQEIISTRTLQNAYLQSTAGVTLAEIMQSVTLGWPEELISQTGLDKIETPLADVYKNTNPACHDAVQAIDKPSVADKISANDARIAQLKAQLAAKNDSVPF